MLEAEGRKPIPPRISGGPGVLLPVMAVLCAILVLVPLAGTLLILLHHGVLTPAMLMNHGLLALFAPASPLMVLVALPTAFMLLFAVAFLVAFGLRARGAPSFLPALALLWAISLSANTLLVPILTMPAGLPAVTLVNMVPGLISPVFFALGFAGFMRHSPLVQHWFRLDHQDHQA